MRLLVPLLLFFLQSALAHQSSLSSSQKEIRWNYSHIPIRVINNSSFYSASALIDQSIAEWNAASAFQISKVTTSTNSIKFSNDPTIFGSAVVGVTELSYNKTGVINNATIYLNEAQISETRVTGKTYLGDVVTHELGHFTGLAHSEVLNSSMFYLSFPGQSELAADDKAAIRTKYMTGFGKISGYMKGGSQIGVLGVHVQAISRKTGEIISTISDENGFFSIDGLELNDTYYLYTSPLKNLDALSGFLANVQTEFCPSTYIGSFFNACGRANDGIPQGITLTNFRKTVDVGSVSINCNMRAQEAYTFEKLQTDFDPITIFNFGEENRYEKSYVGYFRKDQLSSNNWSMADKFVVDLTDLDPADKKLRIRLISQPLGNLVEYKMTLYRGGVYLGSFTRPSGMTPEGTWQLDLNFLDSLSVQVTNNVYTIEVQAKILDESVAKKSIPDFMRFGSNSSLPYMLNLSLENPAGLLVSTEASLSDNSSCLDAPFTYPVQKTTAFSEEISEPSKAAAAATCGTIQPPGGPGPGAGSFLLLISAGFVLTQLASGVMKRGKNFLS